MKLSGKTTAVRDNMGLDGQKATIDESSMSKLWGFLQDPYKNSIGAIVREYVSNCFDAHAEADFIKNSSLPEIRIEYPIYNDIEDAEILKLKENLQVFDNDAVIVTMEKDDTGSYWKAEDFGVGLSPQRVTDVFCSYLKSTKESTNNVIGAFGIGSKSALSYVDLFFIRTRYNGTEYNYMLRKGEEAPVMDTLGTVPTEERNGTEIKIYIKNYSDEHKFREECKKQLAYFDNVFFGDAIQIKNHYTILQGENWIVSSNGIPFNGLHLCLGKVAYPIDWDNLGIKSIKINAGLKFEIGELDIIQTREDVRYTNKTKKAIKEKIEALQQEVINKWETDKQYEIYDLQEYYQKKGTSAYVEYKSASGFTFEFKLNELVRGKYESWKFMPFHEIGLRPPVDLESCIFEYRATAQITAGGHRKLDHSPNLYRNIIRRNGYRFNNHVAYRLVGDHTPKKSKYIREVVEGGRNILIIRHVRVSLKRYIKQLNLDKDNKQNWRKQIIAFQKVMQKFMMEHTQSYKKVVVDPEWLKAQRNPRVAFDRKKFVINLSVEYSWEKTKWIKGNIDRQDRYLFVMGVEAQKRDLDAIGKMFSKMYPNKLGLIGDRKGSYLRVGYVAPTNLKYLENVKNLITVGNFHNSKPFKRAMTAYHVRTLPEYEDVMKIIDSYDSKVWDNVYEPISDIMWDCRKYMDTNGVYKTEADFRHEEIIKSGYALIKEQDAFDDDYMAKLDLIKEYITNIPLLMTFLTMIIHDEDSHTEDIFIESCLREEVAREIVKAIVMHNSYMPKKQRKKINGYYHVLLRTNEMSWLSKEDQEFIKYIQRPKLKYV